MKASRRMQPQPWIKTRAKELGKTLKGLGQAMGDLDSARVTEIIAGTRRVQTMEVEPMAKYLQLPYEEVYSRLFGSVPSVKGDVYGPRPALRQEPTGLRVHPVRDLGGGVVVLSRETASLAFPSTDTVPQSFNCFVTTDYMAPAYEIGDDLLINPTLPVAPHNDVLLVAAEEGQAVRAALRRLVEITETHWVVRRWATDKTERFDRKTWHPLRVEGVKKRG